MLKRMSVVIFIFMFTSHILYAEHLQERKFRNDRGGWIIERYIKIAEYEIDMVDADIEGDVYIGRSYVDGDVIDYWIMIYHEVEFSKRLDLSDDIVTNVRLNPQRITINGTILKGNQENLRSETKQKQRDVKEYVRMSISESDFANITKGTPWQGSIMSETLPSPIVLRMKNRSKVLNALNKVNNKMEIRLKY
ncbi:hypothetical protein PVA44_03240 [Entomospira nematocerorum]|uniref:Uncharacterized protein n=1 Tax=Entomospira nematocerorum TaxID=2719987 RepID=A0A968KXW9_9SPIO|nr:hypothetical protein [Entomospira nematocera]NIZ46952.1 hypothetical protein [Entomospira nematocera]WDI34502.1 hypothetical protein PVA44_03240 [Entomospira nematocera]